MVALLVRPVPRAPRGVLDAMPREYATGSEAQGDTNICRSEDRSAYNPCLLSNNKRQRVLLGIGRKSILLENQGRWPWPRTRMGC